VTERPEGPAGDGGAPARPRRTVTRIAAELADVERHLRDVPPHSGGGRHVLEARRAALQRELSERREEAT
jgi:hypothetical protein